MPQDSRRKRTIGRKFPDVVLGKKRKKQKKYRKADVSGNGKLFRQKIA